MKITLHLAAPQPSCTMTPLKVATEYCGILLFLMFFVFVIIFAGPNQKNQKNQRWHIDEQTTIFCFVLLQTCIWMSVRQNYFLLFSVYKFSLRFSGPLGSHFSRIFIALNIQHFSQRYSLTQSLCGEHKQINDTCYNNDNKNIQKKKYAAH